MLVKPEKLLAGPRRRWRSPKKVVFYLISHSLYLSVLLSFSASLLWLFNIPPPVFLFPPFDYLMLPRPAASYMHTGMNVHILSHTLKLVLVLYWKLSETREGFQGVFLFFFISLLCWLLRSDLLRPSMKQQSVTVAASSKITIYYSHSNTCQTF